MGSSETQKYHDTAGKVSFCHLRWYMFRKIILYAGERFCIFSTKHSDFDHVFVMLHFVGPLKLFSCLHVRNLDSDSLENVVVHHYNYYLYLLSTSYSTIEN